MRIENWDYMFGLQIQYETYVTNHANNAETFDV